MFRSLILFCVFAAFEVSCGSSDGGGAPAGGTCSANSACSGGICAVSQDFPSGYCTQGCQLSNPSSCPSGSVCIDDVSGVPADAGVTAICYQGCQTTADCGRPGFACLEKANRLVCRNGT
jgi:hypothetical protein